MTYPASPTLDPSSNDNFPPIPQAIQRLAIPITLAMIQAQTSGSAFNIGKVLPTNARVMDCEVAVTTPVSGGSLSGMTLKVQGSTDAAGALMGAQNVFTGCPAVGNTIGSNPYASRGGQQLQATLTASSDTLANATAGALIVNVFYAIVS